MSLAYAVGRDGKLQVAYEAMDKISIFKTSSGEWQSWCPCHHSGVRGPSFEAVRLCTVTHINWHMDDE